MVIESQCTVSIFKYMYVLRRFILRHRNLKHMEGYGSQITLAGVYCKVIVRITRADESTTDCNSRFHYIISLSWSSSAYGLNTFDQWHRLQSSSSSSTFMVNISKPVSTFPAHRRWECVPRWGPTWRSTIQGLTASIDILQRPSWPSGSLQWWDGDEGQIATIYLSSEVGSTLLGVST